MPIAPWVTNSYGVSTRNNEDFGVWNWEASDGRAHQFAVNCADLIMDEIAVNTMACITFERGIPEVNIGLFEFEADINVRILPLVNDWIGDLSGRDGAFYPEDRSLAGTLALLDELAQAHGALSAALSRISEPLAAASPFWPKMTVDWASQ